LADTVTNGADDQHVIVLIIAVLAWGSGIAGQGRR
jgi:hypothetical protein